jgi:hypothetical protein
VFKSIKTLQNGTIHLNLFARIENIYYVPSTEKIRED